MSINIPHSTFKLLKNLGCLFGSFKDFCDKIVAVSPQPLQGTKQKGPMIAWKIQTENFKHSRQII